MGKRPTQEERLVLQRRHEADHPADTAVARGQPQDPEQDEWGDELDVGEGLSDADIEQIKRGE